MRSGIRKLQKRIRITSLYVTHDQIEALTISDQIAVMNAGKIVEIGRPTGYLPASQDPICRQFYRLTNIIPGQIIGKKTGR